MKKPSSQVILPSAVRRESALKQGDQRMINLNSSECPSSSAVFQESALLQLDIRILGAWLSRLSPFWTTLNSKMAKCNLIVIVNIQTFETVFSGKKLLLVMAKFCSHVWAAKFTQQARSALTTELLL
jgi:hypothetical protein